MAVADPIRITVTVTVGWGDGTTSMTTAGATEPHAEDLAVALGEASEQAIDLLLNGKDHD